MNIATNKTYSSDKSRPAVLSLKKFGKLTEITGNTLFYDANAGCIRQLGYSNTFRLFFLLAGNVFLEGDSIGNRRIPPKKFLLLPPGTGIGCTAFEYSRYVVMDCTGLNSIGNTAYWCELEKLASKNVPAGFTLPVHGNLEKLLNCFATYFIGEDRFSSIFDTVFILMQMLYSKQEMLMLFHPIMTNKIICYK